ncbi:MAG: UbiD family decarboxylase [Desulfuromonadaceae bacterium]|nr:UbiD family decarboxylase [Desulfuromonadaceae bacterium]MDD5105492.1 UbiD family decarboxylase [Desulfuromonadaceae bacterium]
MGASPLHQFITRFEAVGELSRISVPVDTLLEIAAITDRICKQPDGGSALLFEHPHGSAFPVVTNLFGSEQRVCQALGITGPDELTIRLSALLEEIPVLDINTLDRQIAALPEFNRFAPHPDKKPDPMLVSMNQPDLTRFPFLQSWPDDGSADNHPRYMTLAQVITADPDGGTPNCGVYRIQLRGKTEAAIQWKPGSGAARHAELHLRMDKKMPVAIVLGSAPATLFSAMFPLPGELDELTFAGYLQNAPVATVPCLSVPLRVPTGAEVVIEGFVEQSETVTEGPFGNHTGFYAPAAPAPLMRVTAISHRLDAIIPATVVGAPPMEDCWMMLAWERLLLALLRKVIPLIHDIHFPHEWVFHQSAVISLENPRPGMVRNISGQLWALPWFRSARVLLFVSAAEAGDLPNVLWKSINMTSFSEDVFHDTASERIAIDATGWREHRPKVKMSSEYAALVACRWKEYMLP